jgi:hypothetical protein
MPLYDYHSYNDIREALSIDHTGANIACRAIMLSADDTITFTNADGSTVTTIPLTGKKIYALATAVTVTCAGTAKVYYIY